MHRDILKEVVAQIQTAGGNALRLQCVNEAHREHPPVDVSLVSLATRDVDARVGGDQKHPRGEMSEAGEFPSWTLEHGPLSSGEL